MKRIIFSVAISCISLFAAAQTPINEHQASWAYTKHPLREPVQNARLIMPDSITIRVLSNIEGEVVKMFKYYTALDVLPIHIRTRIAQRFFDYTPTAIIEEHNLTGVQYVINLAKGSEWLQVHLTSRGRTKIIHRYHNSLLNTPKVDFLTTLP